ncbi:hypothetical protein, partial [Bifidobacterium animalis]|uniref:hypothetical protein n=1 Tax=Bifidobacterium animalis TaxID=28025 RepID=UPI00214A2F3E
ITLYGSRVEGVLRHGNAAAMSQRVAAGSTEYRIPAVKTMIIHLKILLSTPPQSAVEKQYR